MQAVERYVLGEMTPAESEEFELHFFACSECTEDLRLAVMMADNLIAVAETSPAVAPEARKDPGADIATWRRPWIAVWGELRFGVPALAGLMLCTVALYQNLVTIPRLRQDAAAVSGLQAPVSYSLRAAARGSEAEVVVPRGATSFLLRFDPTWDESAKTLDCELRPGAGGASLHTREPAPEPGRAGYLLVPARRAPAGRWTLIIRDGRTASVELAHYTFQIRYE